MLTTINEAQYAAALMKSLSWSYLDALAEADKYNKSVSSDEQRPLLCYPHPDVQLADNQLKNVETGEIIATYINGDDK